MCVCREILYLVCGAIYVYLSSVNIYSLRFTDQVLRRGAQLVFLWGEAPFGISNEVPAVGGRYPRGTPHLQTNPLDHNTV